MFEVALLSMFLGGLSAIMQREGGLRWLIERIYALTRLFKVGRQRAGEIGISFMVVFSNLFVANNTVAIILAGDMAREVAKEYGVNPKRAAALMDIFSCVVQGLIPYGAQLLLACSIAKLSPVELIGGVYYCWILAIFAVIAIAFRYPKLKQLKLSHELKRPMTAVFMPDPVLIVFYIAIKSCLLPPYRLGPKPTGQNNPVVGRFRSGLGADVISFHSA